ncbi:MAG: helix-turn-helix domain-containing protein [Candidatus Hydrogenedentes bacterium]|nr:helix-turn-helix domain-containing protein [Candidatus Hydrogenedentota bacterium]
MDKILTVNDVAAILQVKAITVREMFREKRLRGFKVGKAWRTTESMLGEDIDALARGESPAELPTPESRNDTRPTATPSGESMAPPALKRDQKKAAANTPRKNTTEPAPQTAQRAPEHAPETPEKSAGLPAPDKDDDTQQMLF